MIKMTIAALSMLLAFTVNANAQLKGMTDLEAGHLKGKVKEVNEYDVYEQKYLHADTLAEYQRRGLKPPYMKRELRKTTTFNSDGYIDTEKEYGSFGQTIKHTYKKPGYFLKSTYFNENGEYRGDYSFFYDDKGLLTHAVKILDGDTIFTEIYEQKPEERIISFDHINNGVSSYKMVIEYYPCGRMKRMLNIKGGMVNQDIQLDENSLPTKVTRVDFEGKVHRTAVTRGKDKNTSVVYLTDANGKESIEQRSEETLDKYGNTVTLKRMDADGNIKESEENTYSYDPQGNWTVWIRNNTKRGEERKERTISYY